MKTTFKYLSMAAIAVAGAIISSCTSDDLTTEAPQPKVSNTVTLTTTISLDGSSATRALDADGKKTFAVGDKIAVIYKNTSSKVVKAVSDALTSDDITNDGKKAKITVKLTDPGNSSSLRLIYPAAMAKATIDESATIDDDGTIDFSRLDAQNGTLTTIASDYDLAIYDGSLTDDAKLPSSMNLTNPLTICEFTIKDYAGTNDLTSNITGLTVKVGTGTSALTYTVTRTAAAGPIYVAMQPFADSDITITATDGTTNYTKSVSSQSLIASTMTPVNVKMQKIVDLASQTSDYEAQNGDILTGTLGTNIKISIAAGATVTLKDVNINMKDDGTAKWTTGKYAGITCNGDATIILEGTNKVHGFNEDYPGIQAAHNDSGDEYTLTIQGDGSLTATGTNNAAGIGSGNDSQCGNITISGGTLTANGGKKGAGIGSSYYGKCSNITISGGTITAQGGEFAAGIGSGYLSQCDAITISGGTIEEAQGGEKAAGIGSGFGASNAPSTCGNITISGGTISKAQGDKYAAGIGSGYWGQCGNITISGGTVTAQGGQYSAGIGSGFFGQCGDITISGGTIEKAQGGEKSAGIGTGYYGKCGDIAITTGVTKVVATKGKDAPNSIGEGHDSKSCGTIIFGSVTVFDHGWTYNSMDPGNYGGLTLSISTKTNANDTWTLKPTASSN